MNDKVKKFSDIAGFIGFSRQKFTQIYEFRITARSRRIVVVCARRKPVKELALANPFGAPVYHEETLSSTMDAARDLAAGGAPRGTVICADFQEAGRGRTRGRSWLGDRGDNLFFTILLRCGSSIPPALTLRTGLAVSLALEDFAPLAGRVRIKWPNDVLILLPSGARKAAGILTEAGGGPVFIGVGVNVSQAEFPPELRSKAVSLGRSLRELGLGDLDPEARFTLLERILGFLYRELEGGGLGRGLRGPEGGWRPRLEERLYMRGEQVRFIAGPADSGEAVTGRLLGIGPGGELLILPDGRSEPRAFVTGELDL
jgi:BirA family biotin operon repressor/biotin-[acetyl-CoA-carboxylase] ligase